MLQLVGDTAALLLIWPKPGGFPLILQKTTTTYWSVEDAVLFVYWSGIVYFFSLLVAYKDLCIFSEPHWLIWNIHFSPISPYCCKDFVLCEITFSECGNVGAESVAQVALVSRKAGSN